MVKVKLQLMEKNCMLKVLDPEINILYHYTLEKDGFYTLNIFNINGQLINTLKSENGQKGIEYTAIWDAKHFLGYKVPSGLYLYQLETVEGSLSKKMLLLK